MPFSICCVLTQFGTFNSSRNFNLPQSMFSPCAWWMCTPLLLAILSCDAEPVLQRRLLHGSLFRVHFRPSRQKWHCQFKTTLRQAHNYTGSPHHASFIGLSLGLLLLDFIAFLTSAGLPFKMFKAPCNLSTSASQQLGGIAMVYKTKCEHWCCIMCSMRVHSSTQALPVPHCSTANHILYVEFTVWGLGFKV
jgi:hypothetical protein